MMDFVPTLLIISGLFAVVALAYFESPFAAWVDKLLGDKHGRN